MDSKKYQQKILTESSKSSASIAKSNKQWVGTYLYQEGYKPLMINCEAVIRLWVSSESRLRISDWLQGENRIRRYIEHQNKAYWYYGGEEMLLLSKKTSIKDCREYANLIGHMCYAASKTWLSNGLSAQSHKISCRILPGTGDHLCRCRGYPEYLE